MRKIYFLLLTVLFAATIKAQNVNVSGAVVGNGLYPTLGAAFTAINGGAQTGATISITILGNTTEAASAVLNAGAWTSITITPSGGAARTITGAVTGHLVDLNGADNVFFDGLNTGGNSLTISNTATGASSAIRFIADASSNIIQNCMLQGSASTASNGVVFFSTGTTTGNDLNIINNCSITAAGANSPINAIFSQGTSAAIDNSGNAVSGCNISDYFSAASVSNGISLGTGNSIWSITNNRLFQTATRLYTTANTHNGINITSGAGYTITGNIIGFANASATGTTNMVGNSVALTGTFPSSYTTTGTANATRYIAINCAFTAAGAVSNIQNNTIAGFALFSSSGAATTNGVFCGIAVTSGNVNIGTTTGNTIGSTSGNGSIYVCMTTSGGIIAGIYVTSSNAVAIRNNTMGAWDAMGTTATISGGINGINIAGTSSSYDVSGNTIGNSTNPNMRMGNLTTGANLSNVGTTFGVATGTAQFNGILSSQTGAGTIGTAALPNIITNASLNSANASTSIRGITASGAPNINSNQINNLTTASINSGVASTLLAGMGIFLNSISTNGAVVTKNTINSLSLNNTTTNGTNITGIAVYAGTSEVSFNKVYDITNASTSTTTTTPGTASGVFLRQPAGVQSIFNNMISLGAGQTTNTAFNGIWMQNSVVAYTMNCYYNTINIEGPGATGAQPSFCFDRGSYSTTTVVIPVDIRNNIFNNTRSGGTGKHYAIGNCYGATAVNTGWGTNASNYNVLNAAAATVGFWTTDQTFAGWKTASASDALSLSAAAVPFVNSALGDLHLNLGVTPTQVESGGTAIAGITTDYDNQVRPGPAGSVNGGAFAPDMGADEFDGVFSDLTPPAITYTAIGNTLCLTNQTLSATITDPSGVNTTAGTKPRLYFKKSTDANTYAGNTSGNNGWKYVEATNASSPFSFTTDFSLLQSAVVGGDIIQYFVVAQDLAGTPNVAINSGTFAATPSSVALTVAAFPITGTINSFTTLSGGLSSNVTIGAAGTYTSLTGAGGLFSVLNSGGLNGNVTATILDASVTESGANALNPIAYGCGGPYTLTIKPGPGVTSTLTGSFASGALIRILSKNVVIDGSNNGTTSRDLTLANTNITGPTVLLIGSVGTTPVTNVTLKNSIVINGVNTASALAVTDATTLGNPGYFNGIVIQNNSIQRAYIGLYCNAVVAPGNGSITIQSNDVNSAGANAIRICGLYVQGTDGATITQNNVGNFETTSAENDVGIWMATGAGNTTVSNNTVTGIAYSGTGAQAPYGIRESSGLTASGNNITGNTVTNITTTGSTTVFGIDNGGGGTIIQKNTVRTILNTNTGTFGVYGINVTAGNNVIIRNNFVSDVNHDMTGGAAFSTTFGIFGIRLGAGTGHKVYHNSVNLFGLMPGTATTSLLSAAFCLVGTTSTDCDVRNNIFANNITGGTTSIANVSVFLPSGGNSGMNLTWNNNAYYYGTDAARQGVGQAGTTAGTNFYTTLAAMTAYTSTLSGAGTNDNASLATTAAVPYVSASDLHINNAVGANWCLNGTGANVLVTDDIDNQVRNIPPDIGADEFVATSNATATPSSQTICSGSAITTIVLGGTATSFNWVRDNNVAVTGIAASGTGNISGSLTNTTASPVTVTFTITPINGGCAGPTITATVLVNPTNTITLTSAAGTNTQTVCVNTAITNITYSTTGATGATFSGLPPGVNGSWVANVVTISGTPTISGPFSYLVTLTGGCGGVTASGTINVTPDNTITLTSAPATTAQTVCINTAITNITYSTTGATGATVSGLPAGVNGSWAANVVTISGTPTASGTFNYTVTLTGGCGNITATGSINVTPNNTITLTSAAGTNAQSVCVNSAIMNITYSTTGATGATFSGLPAGVNGSWAANVVTISGSPTATGTFNYTVTLTGGCGVVTATGSITVNDRPSIAGVVVEPTTCVSANGTITLTITGPAGPYAFSWTTVGGSGLNPTAQNQSGLTIGQYTVVVTVIATGCQQTAVYNLVGPGGCAVCPTMGSLTATPSSAVCTGTPVTLTVTGLTNMGITYGIAFKTFPSAAADPYTGGTVIATVANGSLGGGGTTASTTTSSLTAGTHFIYAVLSPIPIDPSCRPSSQTGLVVGQTPVVNPVANQLVCAGASTTAVNFSGTAGATYNWINSNTAIGLGASGSGNIASFVATNATNAPISGTVTVTPVLTTTGNVTQIFKYTGAMQTWTVPAGVTSITIETYGAEGGNGAAGNSSGGGNLGGVGGKGSRATGTLTVTPGQLLNIFVGGAGATPLAGYNGGGSGGNANSGGGGGASDVRYPGATAADRLIVAGGGGGGGRGGCETNTAINGGAGGNGDGNGGNGTNSPDGGGGFGGIGTTFGGAGIGCAGFLGAPGNSGNASGIGGNGGSGQGCCCFTYGAVPGGGGGGGGFIGGGGGGGGSAGTTGCLGNNKGGGGGGAGGSSYTGGVSAGVVTSNIQSGNGLVTITYAASITCTGTATSYTYTVNPTATVNVVANQTLCNGASTTAVNFSSPTTGGTIVYNWTNNTPSIGLAASGSGNIASFVATNAGTTVITATITVTPVYTSGISCTGTPRTFTITVNPTPNAVATPASQTVCSGTPITTINLTSGVAGTTFNWIRDNTVAATGIAASGTGNISGTLTNTTASPVTVTFTITPTANSCPGTPITATVIVNAPLTITCPANITVNSAAGQCGAIVNYPPATATGTPAPTITYSIASGSFFPVGTTTVTATATNTCGSVNCTFTITVLDNQPPVITCPANIIVSNAPNLCSQVVAYSYPTFVDNCQRFQAPVNILPHGGGAITVAGNNLPGGYYFDLRNTTATPKLIGSFEVRFGSAAFGVVPSPAPVSVFVTTSANTYVGNQANAAAWTTIGANIPVVVAGPNSEFSTVVLPNGGFILPPNTTRGIYLFGTVSSLVYDGAGTSNFNPISNAALTLTPGQASSGLFVAALTPRVPNVRINYITMTQTAGLPSGSSFPVGLTTNTFTATDDGGNTATCSFTVRVNDTQAPVVNCPGNITVTTPTTSCTAIVTYTVTGTDNCPGVTTQLVSGPASGSAFPIGVTTVTWRAVDAAGNVSANCSFTVTVLDGQAPVISSQPANRTVCLGSNATFSVVSTFAGSYQWQQWNGTAWVNITGATASSYTITGVTHAMNTNSYRVLITGPCGSTTISNHATLYVNALPFITITPNVPQQLLPGQTVTLTATGTPGGGSYQWFKNNVAIPGATGASLGPLSVLDAGTYKVVYTDPNGCVSTSADVTVSAMLTGNVFIYPNPNSGQFHVRYYNAPNEEATITVYNYLGAIVYQKKHNTGALPYGVVDVDLGERLAIGTYIVDVRNAQGVRIGAKMISVGRK